MKLLPEVHYLQILILFSLLIFGLYKLNFVISTSQIFVTLIFALVIQAFFINKLQLDKTSLLSAFITALSLCILLRADSNWVFALAAFIAITSKFGIRYNQKHIFNPADLALTTLSMLDKA